MEAYLLDRKEMLDRCFMNAVDDRTQTAIYNMIVENNARLSNYYFQQRFPKKTRRWF